ncbi:hypothetical protein AX15_002798 [Amanita polypyramis BW_CC]|nr:hypothetical protein AX15_002798 [Amanita polypyramis BW_CC]
MRIRPGSYMKTEGLAQSVRRYLLLMSIMHHTAPAVAYMYRPPCAHTRLDAGAEIPRYRRDSTPARYKSSNNQHQPWDQMAHAYAWVDDYDCGRRDNQNRKTEQWVLEQRVYFNHGHQQPIGAKAQRQKAWDEVVYTYELKSDEWKRREAEIRHRVVQREVARVRIVQEELRRTEERIRQKREAERQRIVEERAKIFQEKRERVKRERVKLEKVVTDAWTSYETQWAAMQASSDPLTFSSIPWPLLSVPDTPESMAPADIASFLLSPLHSQSRTSRERIRSAQLRWHPDRFRRFMGRVDEADKAAVEEGVGVVARCLNDLMGFVFVTPV